jgi:hypothetical protein
MFPVAGSLKALEDENAKLKKLLAAAMRSPTFGSILPGRFRIAFTVEAGGASRPVSRTLTRVPDIEY